MFIGIDSTTGRVIVNSDYIVSVGGNPTDKNIYRITLANGAIVEFSLFEYLRITGLLMPKAQIAAPAEVLPQPIIDAWEHAHSVGIGANKEAWRDALGVLFDEVGNHIPVKKED